MNRLSILFLLSLGGLCLQGQTSSSITISTNPSGARFQVDGTTYTQAVTFIWPTGKRTRSGVYHGCPLGGPDHQSSPNRRHHTVQFLGMGRQQWTGSAHRCADSSGDRQSCHHYLHRHRYSRLSSQSQLLYPGQFERAGFSADLRRPGGDPRRAVSPGCGVHRFHLLLVFGLTCSYPQGPWRS